MFMYPHHLWNHALYKHHDVLPQDEAERERYRRKFVRSSALKSSVHFSDFGEKK
jgi:hypothetical protein